MLTITVDFSDKEREIIRELAAYFKQEPNEFVDDTVFDIVDDAHMILEEEEEKESGEQEEEEEVQSISAL